MTTVIIPTETNDPRFEIRVALTGDEFVFQFVWNERDDHWYVSLFDALLSPIFLGHKYVIGDALLRYVRFPRRPAGELMVIDMAKTDKDAGFDDIGKRVLLVYSDDMVISVPTSQTYVKPDPILETKPDPVLG